MITLGCDVGSLFSKAVVLVDDDLKASRIMETTGNIAREVNDLLQGVSGDAGFSLGDIDCLVGTGNGADLVQGAELTEDTVTCVGAATAFFVGDADMAIDIGGQSITSILLDDEGDVANFMRNDKCASGSGRFLEVMMRKLNLDITQVDKYVSQSKNPVILSNQCGVFAESEVISHVNAGEETADIVAGICASVAGIVVAQGRRFTAASTFTITGGVALLDAVKKDIKEKLSAEYHPFPEDPRLAGAMGAALLGGSD